MPKSLRLPLSFDPDRLKADLALVQPDEWTPHFNTSYYEGDWSGVALRAVGGRAGQLYPDPTATTRFADTPILDRCPYFQEVLAAFQCPLTSARLLRLAAGSSIREHKDYKLGYEDGELRVHVPIVTNADVAFFLEDERVIMGEGEAWYLDLNLRHRVDNQSATDRIHLVIDCVVDDWLRGLFAGAGRPDFSAEPTTTIVAFLRGIGFTVRPGRVSEQTFVPGIWIERGALVVDEACLSYPGDLLHEAGHLAVMAPARRPTITGDAGSDAAEEMMAIAWSYAAAVHLRLDPAVVFHAEGYRGGSAALIENFQQGRFFGVPMLQWLDMAYDDARAPEHQVAPYPHMVQWLRSRDM